MFFLESHLAARPEPTPFLSDDVGDLLRKEELSAFEPPHAARVSESAI
jgi:hypothetical protein